MKKLFIDEDGWKAIDSIDDGDRKLEYKPDSNGKIGTAYASPILKDILAFTDTTGLNIYFNPENILYYWVVYNKEPITEEFIEKIKPTLASHGFIQSETEPEYFHLNEQTYVYVEPASDNIYYMEY